MRFLPDTQTLLPSLGAALLLATPGMTRAQGTPASAAIPPEREQVAAAVLPLPRQFREGATVLGYGPDGRLTTLRRGAGSFICLAPDPGATAFHVACYHESLEPFMARGRALRASGVKGEQVDTVRFAEVRAGRLRLPTGAAALYSLTGPRGKFDVTAPATWATGARPLFVVYIPNATPESTGMSAVPAENAPWIMFPGTPKAHIMFVPRM